MLQKKQIHEHTQTHESETFSALEIRKAQILAELEDLDSQLNALSKTTEDEDDLEEESNIAKTGSVTGITYCSPDLIGRRRENPNEYGGRCSCRRRDGMSSTGMYGCNGGTMEYYGGDDADSRRRAAPTMPPVDWEMWRGTNC